MSYNTVAEFKLNAFPSGSFNSFPESVVQTELDVASSMINAALQPFHSLPMNTGSYGASSDLAVIYDAERTIATYNLHRYRGLKPSVAGTQDEILKEKYLEVVGEGGLLDRLSRGKFLLPGASDSTPNVREKRTRMFGKPGRVYRIVDSDGKEYI